MNKNSFEKKRNQADAEESIRGSDSFGEKSIGRLLNRGTRILKDSGIDNYQLEARYLMSVVTDKDLATLYSMLREELDDFTAMRYMRDVKKRATHYPLQYIVGYAYFMDRPFICRENVLIPRGDTEELVMSAVDLSPDRDISVLDMCTGSGCIGISYWLEREKHGYYDNVKLVDISADAARLAVDNSAELGADVEVIESDLFENLKDANGNPLMQFDMILSNPPYIRTGDIPYLMKDVRDFEPRMALDGSPDGLTFYRRIISEATEFLVPHGYIILEIGYDQYEDVADILRDYGFQHIIKHTDMSGLDRVVIANL